MIIMRDLKFIKVLRKLVRDAEVKKECEYQERLLSIKPEIDKIRGQMKKLASLGHCHLMLSLDSDGCLFEFNLDKDEMVMVLNLFRSEGLVVQKIKSLYDRSVKYMISW